MSLDFKTNAKIKELANNLRKNGIANNQTDAYERAKEIIQGIEGKVPQSQSIEKLKGVEKEVEFIEDQIKIEIGKDMDAKVSRIVDDARRHAKGEDHAQSILNEVSKKQPIETIKEKIIENKIETVPEETMETETLNEIEKELPITEEITSEEKQTPLETAEEKLFPDIENSLPEEPISKITESKEPTTITQTKPSQEPISKISQPQSEIIQENTAKEQLNEELSKTSEIKETTPQQEITKSQTNEEPITKTQGKPMPKEITPEEKQEPQEELDEMNIPMPDSLEKPKKEASKIYQDKEELPPSEVDDFIIPEP